MISVKTMRIIKKKAADYVREEIRRRILNGELREGDKLPNQSEFAEQLGVSRPSLREALQDLTRLGAIEQRPGLGTILVSRAPALLADSMELPFLSDAEGVIELTETRRLIETGMIGLAVVRATDEEIAEIGRVMDESAEAAGRGDIAQYQEKDLIFHHLIAKAAHNRFVTHMFQAIRQSFEQFLKEAFAVLPEMLDQSMRDHREIYEALKDREQERAMAAVSKHLIRVQKAIEGYYRDGGAGRAEGSGPLGRRSFGHLSIGEGRS
jgi:GntR family transcriptional repressor for pyruvate dehydrogenase complex